MLLYFQFQSKVCIRTISTLNWMKIQFKFSNMIIITYRLWRWTGIAAVLSWMTRWRLLDLLVIKHVVFFNLVAPSSSAYPPWVAASVVAIVVVMVPVGGTTIGTQRARHAWMLDCGNLAKTS
jgi:hypothetical protein